MQRTLVSLVAIALLATSSVQAATYVVNTTDVDLGDADTSLANCDANPIQAGDQCTLRAAIMQANAGPGQDTIVLPLDVVITLTVNGLGGAESGDLDITAPVIITGASLGYPSDFQRLPVIEAANSNRIFDVTQPVAVELRGLRLRNGAPSGASGSNGGALRVSSAGANVLVERVRMNGNTAVDGGAISNAGTLSVVESDFVLNRASGKGAALYNTGALTFRASSVRGMLDQSAHPEAIQTTVGSTLVMENAVIDGTPVLGDETPSGGVYADRPSLVSVRNSSFANFSGAGLELIADGATTLRLFNSVLANAADTDCRISLVAGPMPTVAIEYNLIRDSECGAFAGAGNVTGIDPELDVALGRAGAFAVQLPPKYGSRVIDAGVPANAMGGLPERACLSTDLAGIPRPLDGNADGLARCDEGATEAATLTSMTYTVNVFDQDLVDLNPGDGHCDAVNAAIGDQCTLRAAVMEANARPGPDRVEFADDGLPHTITLTLPGNGGAEQGDLVVEDELVMSGPQHNGRPQVTITTNQVQRLFDVTMGYGRMARFENLRLTGGNATGIKDKVGGAIRLVSNNIVQIETVEFAGNAANTQGGALAVLAGQAVVRNADFHDNLVASLGSAIYAKGQLSLERSSLWNNVNLSGTEREAVRLEGDVVHLLFNTTLSGNSGGVWGQGVQQLDLRELTVVDNTQFGLRVVETGTATQTQLSGSVLSGNGVMDCSLAGGATISANYNVVDDASCAVGGTNSSASPKLAPALTQLDGQLTRVRFPLDGSPLLDAVPSGSNGCLAVDQRNSVRPTDTDSDGIAACEIGAVELFQAEADPKSFTVNVFDQDLDDVVPGDTLCDTSSTPGLQCTLRAAVMESNALPGANTIQIPSPDVTLVLTQPNTGGGASAANGDLDLTDAVSIVGVSGNPDARPLVASSNGDRIFNVNAAGKDILIRGLRLSGGTTTGTGGALRVVNAGSVAVERVAMTANTADQGGGAVSVVAGVVTLDETDLFNNATAGEGAAIRNAADLTVSRSSVRDNVDLQAPGQREAVATAGGGITRLFNSTLTGNAGDAVAVSDGTLQVENSTLYDNDARAISFQRINGEILFVRNSILAGNGTAGCVATGVGNATVSTDGYNLTQANGCDIESGTSNQVAQDVGLGPLVVTGASFSAYYVPQIGSPAIDSGHPLIGGLGCLASDQVGTARATDGNADGISRCDIGAIEAPTLSDVLFADGFDD